MSTTGLTRAPIIPGSRRPAAFPRPVLRAHGLTLAQIRVLRYVRGEDVGEALRNDGEVSRRLAVAGLLALRVDLGGRLETMAGGERWSPYRITARGVEALRRLGFAGCKCCGGSR